MERMNANRTSLEQMILDAEQRAEAFEENQENKGGDASAYHDAAASGLRDNSRKAYYKEFRKVVEGSDVIIEILDARDPLGTRTRKVEEMILQAGGQKRIILLLNKVDLVPRAVVDQWLAHLRKEFPTIAFKASTQQQRDHLGHAAVDIHAASERSLAVSECVGAYQLIQLLKNYSRSLSLKRSITVGVIGYPNVGKSSVINSLKRSKVCGVGSTPGLTKACQQISLDKNLKLMDCPGIVFSQSAGENAAESILRNCIKVELLDDPIAPVEVILRRCKMEQLMTMYDIPPFLNCNDFLVHIARQRGRLRKVSIADLFYIGITVRI
jgi:nuclear GTP-binding protein